MRNAFITTLSVLVSFTVLSSVRAEPPREPTNEDLCERSGMIVCGIPEQAKDIEWDIAATYSVIQFRVTRVLKSCLRTYPTFTYINVLAQTGSTVGNSFPKTYQKGKEYILFLDAPVLDNLYVSSGIDLYWVERPCSDKRVDELKRIIADQGFVRVVRPKGDNLDYAIPKDAEEIILPHRTGKDGFFYLKETEYYISGRLVGRRAWWQSGKLAYEEAIKNNRRHGIYRAWREDGTLLCELRYLNGQLHGPYRTWDEKGKMEETYWIEDRNVLKEAYAQRLPLDKTLAPLAPTEPPTK